MPVPSFTEEVSCCQLPAPSDTQRSVPLALGLRYQSTCILPLIEEKFCQSLVPTGRKETTQQSRAKLFLRLINSANPVARAILSLVLLCPGLCVARPWGSNFAAGISIFISVSTSCTFPEGQKHQIWEALHQKCQWEIQLLASQQPFQHVPRCLKTCPEEFSLSL